MDLLKLYVYTGVPILTCNMLFYSISAISTSITSSQNVVRFISENKKTDVMLFKEELEKRDLCNKLLLIESVIKDILRKHSKDNDEYESTIQSINNSNNLEVTNTEQGFMLVQLTNKNKNNVLDRIDEPVKNAIIAISIVIQEINEIILKVQTKITNNENSYLNKFIAIHLQNELISIQKYSNILEIRINLLFDILKIYNKFV
jgi:hypothetical protein